MSSSILTDPDLHKMTITIPKDLIRRVKRAAADHDMNIVSITVEALEEWLKKHPEKR
jgi:hypothetical protein